MSQVEAGDKQANFIIIPLPLLLNMPEKLLRPATLYQKEVGIDATRISLMLQAVPSGSERLFSALGVDFCAVLLFLTGE